MTMRMPGLAFGGGTKEHGDFRMALDIGRVGEIKITSIRLAFAGESRLQVFVGTASLEARHGGLLCSFVDGFYESAAFQDAIAGGKRAPIAFMYVPDCLRLWDSGPAGRYWPP